MILDRLGAIQAYLRPADGVDLDPFLDRFACVSGAATESADQDEPVLEVHEVTPLRVAKKPRDPATGAPASRLRRAAAQSIASVASDEPLPPEPEPEESQEQRSDEPPSEAMPWDNFDDYVPCDDCQQPTCGSCCGNFCGPPGRVWFRGEWLYWFSQGMHVPPLVTTGPSADQPGYLNTPGTTILFGNDRINGSGRSGVRLTTGVWLNAAQTVGVEGDWLWLATATTNFSAGSASNPILSRPFYDLSPTLADPSQIVGQNVEQVSSPGVIAGTISVDAQTRFQSAGLRMLINLCCSQQCCGDPCSGGFNGFSGKRVDFLIGYRYARLADSLAINENLASLVATEPGSFLVNDSFGTQNVFNGLELGTIVQSYRGRWSLEGMWKLAVGSTHQTVNINGFTTTTQNGVSTTDPGGLLALSSNIGQYSRNQLSVIPQLGANLGFQLTPRLRVLTGYTFLFWSSVVRAGDQIDLNVNSRLLPNDTRPLAGDTQHPQFTFQGNTFWAQGLNVGLEYRW